MSLLPVEEALRAIAESTPLLPIEEVTPAEALGRCLAEDVVAPVDLPPFDNSAVDGYAISGDDLAALAEGTPMGGLALRVRGVVPAGGEMTSSALRRGETFRVMTGGRIPPGASAIVMREDVDEGEPIAAGAAAAGTADRGEVVRVLRGPRAGANVRGRGEEIGAGEPALLAGQLVNPGGLGFLIALGVDRVRVRRRPRVALVATGDELVEAGGPLRPGAVRDSSTPTLAALVASAGGEPVPLPIAPDDRAILTERLREGLAHDALITTGGVSVGDYDFVKDALGSLGVEVRFWRVAMKPGKPFVYGVRGETRVFGLPGNPGSSLACFERFVRPALRKMAGDPAWAPVDVEAVQDGECGNPGDRTYFVRAALSWRDGRVRARPLEGQGSGTLRSLAEANGFVMLPPGAIRRGRGALVSVHVLPNGYGAIRGEAR